MGFSEYELLDEWDCRETSVTYRARPKGAATSAAGVERMRVIRHSYIFLLGRFAIAPAIQNCRA